MNCLVENYVSIDCHKKEVVFPPPTKSNFMFKGPIGWLSINSVDNESNNKDNDSGSYWLVQRT